MRAQQHGIHNDAGMNRAFACKRVRSVPFLAAHADAKISEYREKVSLPISAIRASVEKVMVRSDDVILRVSMSSSDVILFDKRIGPGETTDFKDERILQAACLD